MIPPIPIQPADLELAPPLRRPTTTAPTVSLKDDIEGRWRPWRFGVAGSRLAGFRVVDDVDGDIVSEHDDVDDANRVAELLNRGWRCRNCWWELRRGAAVLRLLRRGDPPEVWP